MQSLPRPSTLLTIASVYRAWTRDQADGLGLDMDCPHSVGTADRRGYGSL